MTKTAWPTRALESWRYVDGKQVAKWFEGPSEPCAVTQSLCPNPKGLIEQWHAQDLPVWQGDDVPSIKGITIGSLGDAANDFANVDNEDFWLTTPLHDLSVKEAHAEPCLHVLPDQAVDKPILWVLRAEDAKRFSRRAVHMGKGASLSLVLLLLDEDAEQGCVQHHLNRFLLDEDSQLHVTIVHTQSMPSWVEHYAMLHAGSKLHMHTTHLAAAKAYGRESFHVRLLGDDSQANVCGLTCAHGQGYVDQVVEIAHEGLRTKSEQQHIQVLAGNSFGGFHSEARVLPGAAKSDSVQHSRSLLLSANAKASSKPRLRIDCDDVQCQHGAIVGQLDEDALFYMQARGLSETNARFLLMHGFVQSMVDRLPDAATREWFSGMMAGVLHALLEDKG